MNQSSSTNEPVRVECAALESFGSWLAQAGGSLCVSTYQAGKVAMMGWDGRQATLLMREFDKPLGLCRNGDRLVLASRHDIWTFCNAPLLAHDYREDQPGRYDALYLPRSTYHTGDLNTHDVAFAGDDLLLVASRFSCLARLSDQHSFTPIWKPKFISDLVPEDRCHLNGLAVRDGRAKYVTALGTTDVAGGWREHKATGGVLIDVESNEIILGGMAMPHSPRWHDEKLWVLNSGAGELLQVDPSSGESVVVCTLPGYLRGLCFVGPFALVGLSKIREKHIFGGLPIQGRFQSLRCGVVIVDTRSGAEVGMFEYTSGCEELYEVEFLPGVLRPMILNFGRPVVRQAMTSPESCFWLRASSEITGEASGTRGGGEGQMPTASPGGKAEGTALMGNLLPDSGN